MRERNLAVLGEIDEHLGVLELADGHFLIDLVVLDQQDAGAAQPLDVEGGARLRGLGRLAVGAERDRPPCRTGSRR